MNVGRLFLMGERRAGLEALRKAYGEKNEDDATMYFGRVNSYDALITYVQEKMQEASS
jgi:hypothetical protein